MPASCGEGLEPPEGVEPSIRPYQGRVFPLAPRRQRWSRYGRGAPLCVPVTGMVG